MVSRKRCRITACLVFWFYLTLGALMFITIEQEAGETEARQSRREFYLAVRHFSDEHRECNATTDNLRGLLEQAEIAWKQKMVFRTDTDTSKGVQPVWNLVDSMAFALSIVTTCGYGEMIPITKEGQMVCIVYAALGIPLCYWMLVTVGMTFRDLWQAIFSSSCTTKYKILRLALYLLVPATVLWAVLFIFPSLVFIQTEGWVLLTALYFSFITLSTIGFGDEMPRRSKPYSAFSYTVKIILIFYILLCMTLMSITFTAMSKVLKDMKDERKRKRQEIKKRRNTIETNIDVYDSDG